MDIRVFKHAVAFALSLVLVGCVSDTELSGDSSVGSGSAVNDLIRSQLDLAAAQTISLNDGAAPVTEGSWARFTPETTWNWQLTNPVGTPINSPVNLEYDADVYVVDMFAQLSSKSIEPLHDLGRKVVCYFSAGTYEPWRPDKELFSGLTLGKPHVLYPQERWLDINDPLVAKLMVNRMDMAVALGCDGVELDNVDGWLTGVSGFSFTRDDQIQFNKVLANEAHSRGLAVALKNNVEMIVELADYFDLVINEECFEYDECEGYLPMIEKGKPVFNAEYKVFGPNNQALEPVSAFPAERNAVCQKSIDFGLQTLFLPIELDGSFRLNCR